MTVLEMKELLNGGKLYVCNDKGYIMVDAEYNTFLAFTYDDFHIDSFNIIEEAIRAIQEF